MTHTATQLEPGLFELDPMLVINAHPVRYVMTILIDGEGNYPASTVVFAADAEGCGDACFYMDHGTIASYRGFADPYQALENLGYDAVVEPVPAG